MNRSRFDKLEQAREPAKGPATEKLERFSREEPSQPAAELAPGPQPAEERFARSEEQALRLERPSPDEQPFRRCPRCQRDSTRFEEVCPNCETRLDTWEAREFNERLWRAQRAQPKEIIRTEEERAAIDRQVQFAVARELHDTFAGPRTSIWTRLGRAAVGLVLFALAWRIPWAPLKLLFYAAGLVCWIATVPTSVWTKLNRPMRGS